MAILRNRDVFFTDPTNTVIPNLGVAKVAEPSTPEEWAVLRWELEHFVCKGEYQRGLERILSTYLEHLNHPQQPAVWVSGFYGSGKSHFVRVLEYLWRDIEFPDGARARGLTGLPADIQAMFRELTTIGRRTGGLWSAAGTLGASSEGSVRLAILRLAFLSAHLPDHYPGARLVIWLKQNGYYDAVRKGVEAHGKEFDRELRNMYVSPSLAQVLFDVVPNIAAKPSEVGSKLGTQYPRVRDISDDELVHTLQDVLELESSTPGKLPSALMIFDELQQYIGHESDRTRDVQEAVEACSARFGSQMLFVATGQSAIQDTPQLQKLQGRFTTRVALSDNDVNAVVRQVVLRKAPDKQPQLKAVLDRVGGEIDRHLVGTKIGANLVDGADLIPDYPLLPVRRRFWESVLRAVDPSGTGAQLRTQLGMVHEAVRDIADKPIGWVIAGDVIYDKQKTAMLQASVLLREMAQIIDQQDDGTADGRLRSRLCALVFLIGKLPTEPPLATGMRADADTLADLLVEDLMTGSAPLRQKVPALLVQLVEAGTLMQLEDEYRLQTRESAQWEADYRRRVAELSNDDKRIADDRATELKNAVGAALRGISLVQGTSKVPRKIELHFGAEIPATGSNAVPIWVRDEWSVSEKTVRQEAQAAGPESPIVFVLLPRRESDRLRNALIGHAAAKETAEQKGQQSSPEGIEARQAMLARQDTQRNSLNGLVRGVLANAKIFQGGGSEVVGETLAAAVKSAAEASLVRMFPRFAVADHPGWGNVVRRALDGAGDSLSSVGYVGDAEKHPVCQEIRSFVGAAGKRGGAVRKHFEDGEYGWPADAIDGALVALLAGGYVRASRGGQPVTPKQIAQSQMGTTDFYSEGTVVSTMQRIGVRKLATDMGLSCKPGDEAVAVPLILDHLTSLADAAGGAAPLPERPSKENIGTLQSLSGNEQVVAVYNQRDQLLADFTAWDDAKRKAAERQPAWATAERLLKHAAGLPVAEQVASQLNAIREQRTLLTDPDPVAPLRSQLADALREAVQAGRQNLTEVYETEIADLATSQEWQRIPEADRRRILAEQGLAPVPGIDLSTDEKLLATLDATSLVDWRDKAEALPPRVAKAREAAAKLLEPKAVRVQPPAATLKTSDDVEGYLDGLRKDIMTHIGAGRPVII